MDLKHRIATKLRIIRKSRKLTQEELAGLIGRSVDAVSNIERAKGLPSLETLESVSNALEIPVGDFFDAPDRTKDSAKRLAALTRYVELGRSLTSKELEIAIKQIEALKA